MPRPKYSITRGRAKTIRDSFTPPLSDKEVGVRAKAIGITKDQWYLAQNPIYLKGKKGNREANQLLKSIGEVYPEPQTKRSPINFEERDGQMYKGSNAEKFYYNIEQNESFAIIGNCAKDIIAGLKAHKGLKVNINCKVWFHKSQETDTIAFFHFRSDPEIILNPNEIKSYIQKIKDQLRNWISNQELRETGWIYDYVESMEVIINKYRPLRGGSYVELDDYIKNKKCCINIKNTDNKCLMYCVLYHFNKDKIVRDADRVSKYNDYLNDFDWSKIKFPTKINQIHKIEELIKAGINIYCYEDKQVQVLRSTKYVDSNVEQQFGVTRQTNNVINLLLVENKHYVYIKNLSVLVSPPQRNSEGKHIHMSSFACQNCLHCFSSQSRLDNHRTNGCDMFDPTKTELPKMIKTEEGWKAPTIQFKHHTRKFKAPVVIYADFETLIQKTDNKHDDTKSSTTKLANLPPCSYGLNVVSDFPELNLGYQSYLGEDASSKFLKNLLKVGDKIQSILKDEKKMIITKEQEKQFAKCKCCHICDNVFHDDDIKVRDHCHISGLYRGASHQSCNINFNYKNYKIPVYFHNLKGFDGHLIIQGLNKIGFTNIDIIAQNFEKYMTIKFGDFIILDSFAFMSSSLDTLAKNLLKDGTSNFKHTLTNDLNNDQIELIVKKGVYPYEYMNSFDRFKEAQLPPIEAFYSTLEEEPISNESYEHAMKVWNTFNCKTMKDYHDLYLKTDIYLLTDIFEAFRNTAINNYDLDPSNGHCCSKKEESYWDAYYTLPNFAWDAMLKKTKISLENITDVDMYLFFEQAIRGGTSLISHRYAKANNKYMSDYVSDIVSSYIIYLDANNLYGHAMIQNLPTSGYKWANWIDENFIQNYKDGDKGYMVKCDLHYPKELHDMHNNYPLAVESRVIKKTELSPYQLNQLEVHDEKHNEKLKKLVPTLYDKKEYICHINNLQYYLKKGLKLTKIHSAIEFDQSPWLKTYIDFNTNMRTKSKNDFEKDLYKLMNNAVFGKTMENVRGRVNIALHSDNEELKNKHVAKPQFVNSKTFGENLIAIQLQLPKVILNKPIAVGACILDLSKLHMYKFHYDYILAKYQEKAKLLFTDTDSLCYHIETEDIYQDMHNDSHLFDRSGYSLDGFRSQDNMNKKVIGKFKDETDGVPIVEFVGLRSKMYSLSFGGDKEKKVGKGIKKSALKRYVKHEDYKRCILGSNKIDQRQLVSFNNFRSINHNIGMYRYTKVGLSCSNDKQYLLDDGISSYSYGHYAIAKI